MTHLHILKNFRTVSQHTTLGTDRFQLRIPDETNVDFVFSASRHPGFNDGMQWEPPTEKASILGSLGRCLQRWDKGEEYTFTVVDREDLSLQLGRVSIWQTEDGGVWSVGFWVQPRTTAKRCCDGSAGSGPCVWF